jgi:Fe-S-cluster containining protein
LSPCSTCGRCCFGPRDYVQIFDEDLPTLGDRLRDAFAVRSGSKRFMRMENGHCAALERSGDRFRCAIYERRPLVCRVYEVGAATSFCAPGTEAPAETSGERRGPRTSGSGRRATPLDGHR